MYQHRNCQIHAEPQQAAGGLSDPGPTQALPEQENAQPAPSHAQDAASRPVNRLTAAEIVLAWQAEKARARENAKEEAARAERCRLLEADRALRLKALSELPAPGHRCCPECGYGGRTELCWKWLRDIDWKLVTYRCDKCGWEYHETETCESNEMEHYHDCVNCGAGYVCNAEGCRDCEYSDGHNCQTKEEETLCQQH